MARPFRQQIDEGILDRAAALIARRGFDKTSVQEIADAVGLSKAGLLHHFPSKGALHEAVLAHVRAVGQQVLDEIEHLPIGAERDQRALEALLDRALAHPGLVALMLTPATQLGLEPDDRERAAAGSVALQAFGLDAEAAGSPAADPERRVRVIGALGALAVLTLAAHHGTRTTAWRRHILATCTDALGHRRPGALPPASDQVEA